MTAARNTSDWALQLSAINRAVDERERALLAGLEASQNQREQLQAQLAPLERAASESNLAAAQAQQTLVDRLTELKSLQERCEHLESESSRIGLLAATGEREAALALRTLQDRLVNATADLLDCKRTLERSREELGQLAARESHLLEQMELARVASSAREASATDRAVSAYESAMRELAALAAGHADALKSLSDQQRDREAMLLRATSALETQLRADIASQRSEADRLRAEAAALRMELGGIQDSLWGRLTKRSRRNSGLSTFNSDDASTTSPGAADTDGGSALDKRVPPGAVPAGSASIAPKTPLPGAAFNVFPPQTAMNSTRQSTELAQSAQELLSLQDESFVRAAYQSILRRPADPGGFEHYVAQVRQGTAKEVIVAGLARSPEGRSRPRELPGLKELLRRNPSVRYLLQRLLRRVGLSFGQSIAAQLRQIDNSLYRMAQASAVRFDRLEADATMIKHLLQVQVPSMSNSAAHTNAAAATGHRPSIVASRVVLHDESAQGVISELSRKIADSAEASLLSR